MDSRVERHYGRETACAQLLGNRGTTLSSLSIAPLSDHRRVWRFAQDEIFLRQHFPDDRARDSRFDYWTLRVVAADALLSSGSVNQTSASPTARRAPSVSKLPLRDPTEPITLGLISPALAPARTCLPIMPVLLRSEGDALDASKFVHGSRCRQDSFVGALM